MKLVATFVLLYFIATCEGGELTVDWEIKTWKNNVDASIISATRPAHSVVHCTFICSMLPVEDSISFYFAEHLSTCHCNTHNDRRHGNDSSSYIRYGIRTGNVQVLFARVKRLLRLFKKDIHSVTQYSIESERPSVVVIIESIKWRHKVYVEHFAPKLNTVGCVIVQGEVLGYDVINSLAGWDCLDLYEDGYREDGLYRITSWDGNDTSARCDMTNGGWTIIQKRFDGSVDFRQNYETCRLGFGNVSGEYWIGLENMHSLTVSESELKVTVEAFPGNTPSTITAKYDYFSIDSAENWFKGNCGDSFRDFNGMKFSTPEFDNDIYHGGACIDGSYGSWWYGECAWASLNGRYYDTLVDEGEAPRWFSCSRYQSVKATEMKIKRVK